VGGWAEFQGGFSSQDTKARFCKRLTGELITCKGADLAKDLILAYSESKGGHHSSGGRELPVMFRVESIHLMRTQKIREENCWETRVGSGEGGVQGAIPGRGPLDYGQWTGGNADATGTGGPAVRVGGNR